MSIHQEVSFDGSAEAIFDALLTSEGHAAFTGAPADISPEAGGAWSAYGGGISGRNIEVVPNERIVQAWRAANWDPGVYSIVTFRFVSEGPSTRVILDHAGYPEESAEHLSAGWHERYWKPLAASLG